MSKRNEDSVERFFRKATSQYDNSFVKQDWEKMEKLLDQQAGQRATPRSKNLRRTTFTGAAITGIIVLVYFLVLNQDHPESRLLADDSLPKQVQAAAGAEAPIQEQKKENPTAALLSLNNSNPTPDKKENPGQRSKTSAIPSKNDAIFKQQYSTSEKRPGDVNMTPSVPLTADNTEQIQGVAGERPERKEEPVKANSLVENKTEQEDGFVNPAEELPQKEKKQIITSRWNVALAIAPDFSSTALNGYSSPGRAFGLLLGFNIYPRISVSTGVLKSFKRYGGDGSEYQPPEGYWQRRTNGVIPEYIDGRCEVLEIPFMIQYGILQKQKSRLYISGGLSSYVMLSEAYDYTFADANPGAARGWRSPEASSNLFDIGHLSIGYEKFLTPAISLGVEPFLKVPLAGIGWSKLDLFTTGAYLNIRYRILKKETVLAGVTKPNR